jgi:ribosomal protein L12E/L44/L45/RPP1/RPP2
LASVEKELQQVKMNNTALARYINARRKKEDWRKEDARKKAEEDADKKAKEGQSSEGLFPLAS